ncbi:S-layer homology domain-containing protein [Bacillus cereus group sp. BfR-BA-01328]|uniref:S-layer homology domain-containing protein n=1 Tax=Bacillus cereus group sp. BfR-BA-01328 TaxID=2920304 RepID=UPI001F572BF4
MKFKNVIATGLITATLFGATMTAQAQTTKFNDVPSGHWSEGAISYLSDNGIVYGYGNGIYGFGDNVTRGQVASIMARYFKLQDNGSRNTYFTDIQNHPFEENINAVIQAGIMKGDGTDKFRPDATLTRYEMSSVLQHAFDLAVKGNMPFNDIPSGHWAKEAIQALYTNGVTSGVGQNQYGGQYDVTREQFAKFMYSSIYKDQNQKPEGNNNIENQQNKVRNILISSGFFKRDNSYVYNTYGEKGDKLFDVMRVQITPNEKYEYRMFINNDNPAVNTSVRKMLNEILPTQGDYLYNVIDNPAVKTQTLKLDSRIVEIETGGNLSVLFGTVNK